MAVAYAMRGFSEKVYGDRRGQVLVHINGESSYLSVVEAEELLIDMTRMVSYIRSERNTDHIAAFKSERDMAQEEAIIWDERFDFCTAQAKIARDLYSSMNRAVNVIRGHR